MWLRRFKAVLTPFLGCPYFTQIFRLPWNPLITCKWSLKKQKGRKMSIKKCFHIKEIQINFRIPRRELLTTGCTSHINSKHLSLWFITKEGPNKFWLWYLPSNNPKLSWVKHIIVVLWPFWTFWDLLWPTNPPILELVLVHKSKSCK